MKKTATIGWNQRGTGGERVSADLTMGRDRREIYFKCSEATLSNTGDPLLAASVLSCMKRRCDLHVKQPVDARLLEGVQQIQTMFASWYPYLHPCTVKADVAPPPSGREASRVGVFFSGGVDSFYTLLRNVDEITDLIFVTGFDIPLSATQLRKQASDSVRSVADRLGKGVVEVETNLRDMLNRHIAWGPVAHGSALATIALLLAPEFKSIYLAATDPETDLHPWGSRPDLDPLWSSSQLELVHDGASAMRSEKTAFIARHPVAMDALRVCWSNPNGEFNCGRCEKCLRTKISLQAIGALESCKTLDHTIDVDRVRRLILHHPGALARVSDNLQALSQNKGNEALCDALRSVLNRPQWQKRIAKHASTFAAWSKQHPWFYRRLLFLRRLAIGRFS